MDLSIIIVSWNVKDKLRRNLQALQSSAGNFTREIFVVDNNSADDSAAMVRQEFPAIRLIVNDKNLGFAAANNQALRLANGRFLLLLNPDMQVAPDTLSQMLAWAQANPQATVSGCQLVDESGKIIKQVRRFPKFFDQLMVTLKVPHLFPHLVDNYLQPNFNYDSSARVDSIRGAFFLINREAWQKIGGQDPPLLDERYFIWFEEVDFCRQVYKLGGEVWYTPVARCLDYVGQSFKQVGLGQTQKYFSDSMLKYFKKWGKKWEYDILKLCWGMIKVLVRKK
ncbi:MAG: glycosyltransferase family 2 protein [Patescibacteria group bacterium]|jgi:hypothetical protein